MTSDSKTRTDDTTNSDDEQGPIAVPRQVHCELLTVLQMGIHDPLSEDILDALERYDFEATREWALENPDAYVEAVRRGTVDRSVVDRPSGGT